MWHCPQVWGSRASATEEAWRAWHSVHEPIEPSRFGRPISWHATQPAAIAEGPSIIASWFAERRTAPG